MERRNVLITLSKFMLGAVGLGAIRNIFSDERGVLFCCTISVRFPKGSSFLQFLEHRRGWIDGAGFDTIVESFQRSGRLVNIDRRLVDDGLVISYSFPDAISRDQFVETVNRSGAVNDARIREMGYKFERSNSIRLAKYI